MDLSFLLAILTRWCFQVYSNLKRGSDIEDGLGRSHKHDRHQDMDQYSGAEDEMSD